MKKNASTTLAFLLLVFSILGSCRQAQEQDSCSIQQVINVSVDLHSPAFQVLQQTGQWAYVQSPEAGKLGLILVNTPQGYRAYDRIAPHICPLSTIKLEVNGGRIEYQPDGTQWDLMTGTPRSGSNVPLKIYRVFLNYDSQSIQIIN